MGCGQGLKQGQILMNYSRKLRVGWCLLMALGLSACASTQAPEPEGPALVLAEPEQPKARDQFTVAKISQLLAMPDHEDDQRAYLFYQRGVHYDRLGMRWLAQLDFQRALDLRPDMAEAYNRLGIYFIQTQQYEDAFQAFDSALELDPEHDYAFLNRGIALYYAGRDDLAVEDLESFLLRDTSDPYRAIWLYLAESRLSQPEALARLQFNRAKLDDNQWSTQLTNYLLGTIDEAELLQLAQQDWDDNSSMSERLCEAYFYLAKSYLAQGKDTQALTFLKLTIATNIYEYVEHRFALLELDLLQQRWSEQQGS
ncbi:lipoprotein NlpI [Corallincola luteus]|uniref:Lipoprotein NlpI n=2 Tax=Corallincola luteus TaxID=1775177 RepID=A0ABY2AQ55_9GAMM|nr:lipoprotein NlpI [Corallincola luteus]